MAGYERIHQDDRARGGCAPATSGTGPAPVSRGEERAVDIGIAGVCLEGNLTIPDGASGLVLFVHGSGSSRHSPRNRFVAKMLQNAGLASLLFDLLTADEEEVDTLTGRLRFDINLLAMRLVGATVWARAQGETRELPLGYFGASTGAAAALIAAAIHPELVDAVVSRGGRPDLAGPYLERVHTPTLLIVGSADPEVLALNQAASRLLRGPRELAVVPGATHLFEEPGTLEEVARLATAWFTRYLAPS